MHRLSAELDHAIHRPFKVGVLVDTLAVMGVPTEAVLVGSGLDAGRLRDEATRVSVRQLLAVYQQAMRLSPDPGLALRVGLRLRVNHFGLYGYALLASASPREAIATALRYRALTSPVVGMHFREDVEEACWGVDDILGLGVDSPLFRFLFEFQLGTTLSLHRDLLGIGLWSKRVSATYPAPPHAALYGELLGGSVAFGQPANELCFDSAYLDFPLALANPATATLLQDSCDRLLAELHSGAGLASQVASLLLQAPGSFPDIDAVAAHLQMSSRTLRRHLQDEGTAFQRVRDEVRCRLAIDHLERTRMTVDDIAASLGFSEGANFRQAFKRWTGRTPTSYRAASLT